MKSEQINSQVNKGFSNTLLHGNCVELLSGMSAGSAGFVLTDPPYMVNYSSSDGRTVPNDDIKLRELLERFGLIERFTPYVAGGAAVSRGPLRGDEAREWLERRRNEAISSTEADSNR